MVLQTNTMICREMRDEMSPQTSLGFRGHLIPNFHARKCTIIKQCNSNMVQLND